LLVSASFFSTLIPCPKQSTSYFPDGMLAARNKSPSDITVQVNLLSSLWAFRGKSRGSYYEKRQACQKLRAPFSLNDTTDGCLPAPQSSLCETSNFSITIHAGSAGKAPAFVTVETRCESLVLGASITLFQHVCANSPHMNCSSCVRFFVPSNDLPEITSNDRVMGDGRAI
jgi:hypothetical protein